MSEKILLTKDEFERKRGFVERIRDEERREDAERHFDERYGILPAAPAPVQVATFDEVIGEDKAKPERLSEEIRTNCVAYVRYKLEQEGKTIPRGLYSLADKKAIAKATTPMKGDVAVIDQNHDSDEEDDKKPGHLALVEEVYPLSATLEISDTNWGRDEVSFRTGSPEELHIVGYIRPTASSAQIA